MFKSRNFLLGLGLGFLISGVILMSISGSISNQSIFYDKNYSVEELKQFAKEINASLYTDEELSKLKDDLYNEFKVEFEANKQEDVNVINPEEINEDSVEPESTEQVEGQDNNDIISFTISEGMDSNEVADFLSEIGILKEKDKFIKIVYNQKLTKRIIAGTYSCDKNINTEELVKLITHTN